MLKITITYKTKDYEFNADNAEELLTKAQVLGIANLEITDLGLTPSEKFTANKTINLTPNTQVIRGKEYVIRPVTEEKAESKQPDNVKGELHFDNAVILLRELNETTPDEKRVKNCLAGIINLDLSDSELNAQHIQRLAPFLPACTQLSTINLNGNRIGLDGATALANALRRDPALPIRKLLLAGNNIQDEGLGALTAALEKLPALEALNISGNGFNSNLFLDSNGRHVDDGELYQGGEGGVIALLRSWENNPHVHLKLLNISGNKITKKEMGKLFQLLPRFNLEALYLQETGLTPGRIKILADVVISNRCPLKKLDISDNSKTIGQELGHLVHISSMKSLVRILKDPQSQLTELYMHHNSFTEDDIDLLISALKNPSKLKVLDISDCQLGSAGMIAFAMALPRFKLNQLAFYNVSQSKNKILKTKVLIAITNGMALNRSIIYLDIPVRLRMIENPLAPDREKYLAAMESHVSRNKERLAEKQIDSSLLMFPEVLVTMVKEYLDDEVDYDSFQQASAKIAEFLTKNSSCQWTITGGDTYQAVLNSPRESVNVANKINKLLQQYKVTDIQVTVNGNRVSMQVPIDKITTLAGAIPEEKISFGKTISNFGLMKKKKEEKKPAEEKTLTRSTQQPSTTSEETGNKSIDGNNPK